MDQGSLNRSKYWRSKLETYPVGWILVTILGGCNFSRQPFESCPYAKKNLLFPPGLKLRTKKKVLHYFAPCENMANIIGLFCPSMIMSWSAFILAACIPSRGWLMESVWYPFAGITTATGFHRSHAGSWPPAACHGTRAVGAPLLERSRPTHLPCPSHAQLPAQPLLKDDTHGSQIGGPG